MHMIRGMSDLVSFLRHFHRGWLDAPGLDPATIPVDLPDGLSLLHRELGALVALEPGPGESRSPFASQDTLLSLDRLARVDGMLEFARENQGNWSARCPLGPGDPPVYSNAPDVWQEPACGFQKVCDSLNHFLITLSLQEAVFSAPRLVSIRYAPVEAVLSARVEPLWVGGWYVDLGPTHNFYVVPGADLILMDHDGLWVGTHDDRDVELVKPDYRNDGP
jgi:hypothetical protein